MVRQRLGLLASRRSIMLVFSVVIISMGSLPLASYAQERLRGAAGQGQPQVQYPNACVHDCIADCPANTDPEKHDCFRICADLCQQPSRLQEDLVRALEKVLRK